MGKIELERISIRLPCPKTWDEMAGDARTRFCDACSLHVHNLSAVTRAEGEALLLSKAEAGGRLCVTYARRADGTLVTADEPARSRALPLPPARLAWPLRAARAAAALAAGAFPFLTSLSALAGIAALAGCRPPATDGDPAAGVPDAPTCPPAPDDGPRLTGEVALPEPVLEITGGISLEDSRELGKVTVERGDVALPPQERD